LEIDAKTMREESMFMISLLNPAWRNVRLQHAHEFVSKQRLQLLHSVHGVLPTRKPELGAIRVSGKVQAQASWAS
jgi:hypothetical protein